MIKIFSFHKLLYNTIIFEIKLYGGLGFSIASSRTTGKASERVSGERSGTSVTQEQQEQVNRQTGTTVKQGEQRGQQRSVSEQRGSTEQQTIQDLTSIMSQLDEGTQQQLQQIIANIGNPEQAGAVQTALAERALNADADLAGNTNAIIASARRTGERSIGQAQVQLAKGAGSVQNTLVQQIGLEADVNLQTELAALEQSLNLQNRQIATGELQGAQTGQAQSMTALVNALKGATQVQEQAQSTVQQTETEQIQQALQDLFQSSTETEVQDLIAVLTGQTTREQTIEEQFARRGAGDSSANNLSGGIAGNMGFG